MRAPRGGCFFSGVPLVWSSGQQLALVDRSARLADGGRYSRSNAQAHLIHLAATLARPIGPLGTAGRRTNWLPACKLSFGHTHSYGLAEHIDSCLPLEMRLKIASKTVGEKKGLPWIRKWEMGAQG